MRQKNTTGTDYVYGRIDQDVALAYSHAMGRDIPDYNYYIDAPGETKQLDALLDTVRAGDRVIVGTITDFMLPDIQDARGRRGFPYCHSCSRWAYGRRLRCDLRSTEDHPV